MFNTLRNGVGMAAFLLAIIFMPLSLKAQGENLNQSELDELSSFVMKSKEGKSPLSWKKMDELGDSAAVRYQVVVETGGERITLEHSVSTTDSSFTLWWRNNPSTTDDRWTSSVGREGKVQTGVDPDRKKICMLGIDKPVGTEHKDHWQAESNKRLRAVLDYYRKK